MASHGKTVFGLVAFIGMMGSIPYVTRTGKDSLMEKEKLSGSERQRGMNLMAGQHDAGPDPNYDVRLSYTYTWLPQYFLCLSLASY